VVGLVIFAGVILVLFAADRLVKARIRARRRRQMRARLAEAAARADELQRQRQAAAHASKALTSVMPAIQRPPLTPADRSQAGLS
jgi:hypothetical protein